MKKSRMWYHLCGVLATIGCLGGIYYLIEGSVITGLLLLVINGYNLRLTIQRMPKEAPND